MNRTLPFDPLWFHRMLLDDILPRWLQHAVSEEGLFLPQLDRQWRRYGEPFGTIVSQSRLLYNFCQGYRLTGHAAYRDAVESGTAFLLNKFRDPIHGGWFHAVASGGKVVDDHKDAYDHAFIIFGLAHVVLATGSTTAKAAMLEAWELLRRRFTDGQGGLIRRMTRDFREDEERRTQNPIMHLFEALLAATEVEPAMLPEAQRVAEFVLGRLVRQQRPICLPEFYTKEWGELSAPEGGHVSIGHQFEWAFLLSSAVERGLPVDWLRHAKALMDFGLAYGYDPQEGGIIVSVTSDGAVLSSSKGWWEQCEFVRAVMHHLIVRNRTDLIEPLVKTLQFIQDRYVDHRFGGWYESVDMAPNEVRPAKGGPFKVDYHVVGMCVEALRLARLAGLSGSPQH
ncbi:MAG: AGE family epimerase/isomerase [Kiritimatiellae bacterium]|nr:AGE family epimerase/isomerase [Kiritimatiellia bacterium]